jgi:hypothetical protein
VLSFDAATTAATPSRLLKNRLLQRNRAEAEFQTDAPRTWDIRRAGSSLADPAVA